MTGDPTFSQLLALWTQEKVKREHQGPLYHAVLVILIAIGFILLMVIPYEYDQYNKSIYQVALNAKTVVIQEYKSVYEASVIRDCIAPNCIITDALKSTKLIALDYVSQMENATKLDISYFWWTAVLSLVLVIIVSSLISWSLRAPSARFLSLMLGYVFLIWFVQKVAQLPHANYKFYYLFGFLVGIVCAAGDYFHNVKIIEPARTNAKFELPALQERHKKWTAILGYSLAIVSLVVGTISFNALSYIRVVFGDSFILAPMVGIALMCAYLILVYILGIIGNIRQILVEIESTIRTLHDEERQRDNAQKVSEPA